MMYISKFCTWPRVYAPFQINSHFLCYSSSSFQVSLSVCLSLRLWCISKRRTPRLKSALHVHDDIPTFCEWAVSVMRCSGLDEVMLSLDFSGHSTTPLLGHQHKWHPHLSSAKIPQWGQWQEYVHPVTLGQIYIYSIYIDKRRRDRWHIRHQIPKDILWKDQCVDDSWHCELVHFIKRSSLTVLYTILQCYNLELKQTYLWFHLHSMSNIAEGQNMFFIVTQRLIQHKCRCSAVSVT